MAVGITKDLIRCLCQSEKTPIPIEVSHSTLYIGFTMIKHFGTNQFQRKINGHIYTVRTMSLEVHIRVFNST